MYQANSYDHKLHAAVDHQLHDDEACAVLNRTIAEPDGISRCTAYVAQREALAALRQALALPEPAQSLVTLQEELHAALLRQAQLQLGVAVGGALALTALVGYAGRHNSTTASR